MTTASRPGQTRELAEFVSALTLSEVPQLAADRARTAIADVIGVAIAGRRHRIGSTMLEYVADQEAREVSGILGGGRTSPELAGLVNGTFAHAMDFDDSNHPLYGHPSCHLVPAMLAVGEECGASFGDALTAYIAGFEVDAALASAMNMAHYETGFHSTGTIGTVGAAAAAARTMGLDGETTQRALGIAASRAAGIRANTGTMTKPLHAGAAAMGGIQAARLAARGWDADPAALEADLGFCSVFMGRAAGTPVEFAAQLGRTWSLLDPVGLAIKPYPSCGASHPAVQAALTIHTELGDDEIRQIRVGVSALAPKLLVHNTPVTGNEARFSAQYTVAAALVRGHLDLSDFTSDAVADPAVRALMERITVVVDERHRDGTEFPASIEVHTMSGRRIERTVEIARGKNADPMSDAELEAKFIACAGPAKTALWAGIRKAALDVPVAEIVASTV
ncbi:MmgE/PrpD family protein [Rhodococcus pseudokoreensis]|uniref:MmgE/PrpD family protein n=1 Tax=Rhodococcus pseudokoreensis TaxID=2811421 RepID=A0A974ZVQ5_9NOCA|nr:MmgE/PrpD family protein [Rhodococcus pseudokoreensis]QSE92155.1 MmgE/PrpD family protein [Rhodococcus pseudokoreensis]